MACLDLEGRSVLVVGGGRIAKEKVAGLLECGADVTVVAPRIRDDVRALPVTLAAAGLRGGRPRPPVPRRRRDRDRVPQRRVSRDAAARSLLCNVVDDPEKCTVILPAVHRQGPIAIAVSTGGASPALAKWLRDRIAAQIGPTTPTSPRQLRALRPWAKEACRPTTTARRTSSASSRALS